MSVLKLKREAAKRYFRITIKVGEILKKQLVLIFLDKNSEVLKALGSSPQIVTTFCGCWFMEFCLKPFLPPPPILATCLLIFFLRIISFSID